MTLPDFSRGLPNEIKNDHFDYIISTYAIHHLTDEEKIYFIRLLSNLLSKKGKILIGDVSFETRSELEKTRQKYGKYWDSDEVYFVAKEIKSRLNKGQYSCKYIKISHCAGVLTVTNE